MRPAALLAPKLPSLPLAFPYKLPLSALLLPSLPPLFFLPLAGKKGKEKVLSSDIIWLKTKKSREPSVLNDMDKGILSCAKSSAAVSVFFIV